MAFFDLFSGSYFFGSFTANICVGYVIDNVIDTFIKHITIKRDMLIHFWELPENRNYIILKKKFKEDILYLATNKRYPFKIRNKIKNGKISIAKLKQFSKNENISLEKIESNILWIGGNNSQGLSTPKFPINLSSKNAARFIAAIMNDGTLTKESLTGRGRLMYDNFDKSLRESVLKDCLMVFGGKPEEIRFVNTRHKKYFSFSSVIRDIVELVIKHKGPKCETNLEVPKFIFENKSLMAAWIEQTIADEGEVKYYPSTYRRVINWRRSLDVSDVIKCKIGQDISIRNLPIKIQEIIQNKKCNLILGEEKMLNLLGIKYRIYNLGIYPTTKNKIRTRWQISITKRCNLCKLRNIITIPLESKNKKLIKITKEFVRFKEPIKIQHAVMELGKFGRLFNSIDLRKKMHYKTTNTANVWLNFFEKKGLVKKIEKSSYGGGMYRKPALYTLTQNK